MKTDDTLVRDYLAAVARESALLPPDARQELMADLGEHIEVALAQRPGGVREILAEMGDPRAIAATAMQELGDGRGAGSGPDRGFGVGPGFGAGAGAGVPQGNGGAWNTGTAWAGTPSAAVPRGRRRSPAEVPLVLLLLADVLPYVSTMSLFSLVSFALLITALVMVCRSRHWDRGQKWVGLTATLIVPTLAHIAWWTYFVHPDDTTAPEAARWTLVVVLFLVVAAGSAWLWRKRRV
ncbi:HAAS signaling domain-containing protein [Streptomyces sp. NRRL F-5630]|uniref:HAAS signaling domain-containing protein n=1 Tax=Streptomyces sp. NRRL F-5630 TaxID=1463864 RepID=UPI003D75580C